MSSSAVERREVFYSGHVQGVGFRFTVTRLASRFEVTGYVKNLADGRVQVVAEGKSDELDGFLAAIAEHMGANIRDVTIDTPTARGAFHQFEIRH